MTTPTQRKPYRKLHSEDNDLILKMLARMQPLSIIAKSLKCDRRTLAKHIKANPDLDEAFKESYERLSDLAESKLLEKINAGDLQAIIFYLERRCAHRGWSKNPLPIRDPSQERIIFIGQPPKPPPPSEIGDLLDMTLARARARIGPGSGEQTSPPKTGDLSDSPPPSRAVPNRHFP